MPQYKVRIEMPGDTHAVEVWLKADSPLIAGENVYQSMSAAYGIDKTDVKRIIEIEEKEKPTVLCVVCQQPELRHAMSGGHRFQRVRS
jgi:hypothetical protein